MTYADACQLVAGAVVRCKYDYGKRVVEDTMIDRKSRKCLVRCHRPGEAGNEILQHKDLFLNTRDGFNFA